MNYKPAQNPTYVNDRIQEYIDTVMHPNCETGKDKWTVESMVSWERFGSTICRKCHDNREHAHYLIRNEYMPAYDRVCTQWLDPETTPYRELPYEVRGKIETIGMEHISNVAAYTHGSYYTTSPWVQQRRYTEKIFEPTCIETTVKGQSYAKNSWTLERIYKAGLHTYTCKDVEVINAVTAVTAEWNALAQKRKCDAMESRMAQMEAKLSELETRITELC